MFPVTTGIILQRFDLIWSFKAKSTPWRSYQASELTYSHFFLGRQSSKQLTSTLYAYFRQ